MKVGSVSNLDLNEIPTSAGPVYFPARAAFRREDVIAIAQAAARKLDGAFTVTRSAEGAGGISLTVVTNAGSVTVGPLHLAADVVDAALDWIAREGKVRDGLL